MGFYRMEIWEAKINHNFDKVIKDKHPVVIISHWSQCVKPTGTISVIPITSTLDNFKKNSHVKIEGYGLYHTSKILCNQVLTIDKICLTKRIGKITDLSKIKEIESVLGMQLSLKSKCKDVDLGTIENDFMSNLKLKELTVKVDYRILRNKILNVYLDEKNYSKTIKLCNELICAIGSNEENDMLWASYYMLILSNVKLKNYKDSLENCKFMFKYIDNNNISNYNISMMLLSSCYLNLGQESKAIHIYKQVIKYAKQYGSFSIRIVNIWNICRINKDINKMEKLMKILEKHNWDDNE